MKSKWMWASLLSQTILHKVVSFDVPVSELPTVGGSVNTDLLHFGSSKTSSKHKNPTRKRVTPWGVSHFWRRQLIWLWHVLRRHPHIVAESWRIQQRWNTAAVMVTINYRTGEARSEWMFLMCFPQKRVQLYNTWNHLGLCKKNINMAL